MGADVLCVESQHILPHDACVGAECLEHFVTREVKQLPFVGVSANGGVAGRFFVREDTLDGKCQGSDGVE